MKQVFVHGWGAVAPSGWGASALFETVHRGAVLKTEQQPHPCFPDGLRLRKVPEPSARPAHFMQARLRRTSPISHYAAGAALEALNRAAVDLQGKAMRIGVVYAVLNGCVNFSRRFFAEVLSNPATASPLLFPETVSNSPSSHISALLANTSPNYTLLGDHTAFIQGVGLGIDWLLNEEVDGCLIVGAEEADWLVSGGAALFNPQRTASEGAGAVYLSLTPMEGRPEIVRLVEPTTERAPNLKGELHHLLGTQEKDIILRNAEALFPAGKAVHSLEPLLGDAFTASTAWQTVAALEYLAQGEAEFCTIPVHGSAGFSAGLRLGRTEIPGR